MKFLINYLNKFYEKHFCPPKYKNLSNYSSGLFLMLFLVTSFLFTSCVEELEAPKIQSVENGQLMKVKAWFEENKTKLRIPERGSNFRSESQELILPFFEKEPDWDQFHHYYFPDGREVFEVSLENATKYFPKSFLDSFPDQNASKFIVQNIMFIKDVASDRFDPLIARYYPGDEYSKSKMKKIFFNGINEYWSGRIDIFTYDEHHFVGFEVFESEIKNSIRYGVNNNLNSRIAGDCQVYTREVVWVSNEPGDPEDDPYGYGTTYHSLTITEVSCTGSMGENPPPGTIYVDGEPYYQFGNGNEGCPDCDYLIPIISDPESIILDQLDNPCASSIFKQLMKTSAIKSSVGHLSQVDEMVDLLNNSNDFDFIVKDENLGNFTDSDFVFNTETGKNEVTIYLDNSYLASATKLSIARTILHESIHAYLVYIGSVEAISGTANDAGFVYSEGIIMNGLINNGLNSGLSLNDVHHIFIPQFAEAIGFSLHKWYNFIDPSNTIPRSYFDDVAWGGLSASGLNESTNEFEWYPQFELLFPSESERNRIHSNIVNEYLNNDDAKSNPC